MLCTVSSDGTAYATVKHYIKSDCCYDLYATITQSV